MSEKNGDLYRRTLVTAIGGGLGIFLMVALAFEVHLPIEAVPFVTSIILVMASPDTPLTQPRNIIGGHIVCALAGLAVWLVAGTNPWTAGIAVAIAIAVMQLTRTLHPPAGINAVLFVTLKLSWSFVLMPVAAGAVLLVAYAWAYHRLTLQPWPRSWWAPLV